MKIKWTVIFREVKLLTAQDQYVVVYLLGLIKRGETFNVINMSWFSLKAKVSWLQHLQYVFRDENL